MDRYKREKQVTRGHNIVADGLAGAANPHPHPTPFPTQTHTQKASKRSFFHFLTCAHGLTDLQTDGPTDQRTDKASHRVTCPQLKRRCVSSEKKMRL